MLLVRVEVDANTRCVAARISDLNAVEGDGPDYRVSGLRGTSPQIRPVPFNSRNHTCRSMEEPMACVRRYVDQRGCTGRHP